MRQRLALTIFLGVAAVLVAIAGLASESAWLALAAAVAVHLAATAIVVGGSLASMDDSEDRT
jgi:predicted small integral membrane protein